MAVIAFDRLLPMLALAALPPLAIPATAGAAAGRAASCAGIRAANPAATDGDYSLHIGGATIHVFCHDMAQTPAEYIDLVQTGGGHNFSQYTAGGASRGTTVVTHYTRLRVDPHPVGLLPLTFRVNIADQTFSSSTGQLCHSSPAPCSGGALVRSMPYAVAFDCVRPGSSSGIAELDLTGTVFEVVNTFRVQAFEGTGTTSFTPQVVTLTGGGFCGWNAPATTYNPYDTNPLQDANGGYDLQVRLRLP
jgi:GON domain